MDFYLNLVYFVVSLTYTMFWVDGIGYISIYMYKYGKVQKKIHIRGEGFLFCFVYFAYFFNNMDFSYAYFKYHYWEILVGTNFSCWTDREIEVTEHLPTQRHVVKENQGSNIGLSCFIKITLLSLTLPGKQQAIISAYVTENTQEHHIVFWTIYNTNFEY